MNSKQVTINQKTARFVLTKEARERKRSEIQSLIDQAHQQQSTIHMIEQHPSLQADADWYRYFGHVQACIDRQMQELRLYLHDHQSPSV